MNQLFANDLTALKAVHFLHLKHDLIELLIKGGINEPVKLRKINEHTTEAVYQPRKDGRHIVMISYGGQEIAKSPYEVNVGPYKQSDIVVYGPGLHGGVVDYPALFTVETNGETGALGSSSIYHYYV